MRWRKFAVCSFLLIVLLISAFYRPTIAFSAEVKTREIVRGSSEKPIEEKEELIGLKEDARNKKIQEKADTETKVPSYVFDRLPEDNTVVFEISSIRIKGNTVLSDDVLLQHIPAVFNSSPKSLSTAEPDDLYDFRAVRRLVYQDEKPVRLSARTVRGFTQYLLSVYHQNNYAGVYVFVPASSMVNGNAFVDGILTFQILEASVSDVDVLYFDPDGEPKDRGYLKKDCLLEWNPVKPNSLMNQDSLNRFVSRLNQNPDRYVSGVVSRGAEPNSLSLSYEVYEVNPWHFYAQLDSSGTNNRKWNPRFGFVNTNITGRDDELNFMWQGPVFAGDIIDPFQDNYSIYGSYEFPLWTPGLRLKLYVGHSDFNIGQGETAGPASFRGNGDFAGGILRYNTWVSPDEWFFDLIFSLSHERSKVTTTIGPFEIPSDIEMVLWGGGCELHKQTRQDQMSLSFIRYANIAGSSSPYFNAARTDAGRYFAIYTLNAAYSHYFDPIQKHRISNSFRAVFPDERLVPAKMMTFGGIYSVRGYKEDRIVADGGFLISSQYEYDLTARKDREAQTSGLDKFAVLGFVDYGRAQILDAVPGENASEDLCSIGAGFSVTTYNHFNAVIYYGWPLLETLETRSGRGRWGFNFIMRW